VVIASALHAEGRGFNPRPSYLVFHLFNSNYFLMNIKKKENNFYIFGKKQKFYKNYEFNDDYKMFLYN
jgi:hypothetical protein